MSKRSKKQSGTLIKSDDVIHISKLCRLQLSKEEIDLFANQFNDILAFFGELDNVDTSKVSPMFHVMEVMNVFREDKVRPSLPEKAIFENIPKREGKFIKAPRIS